MTIAPVNNILRSISKARSDSDIELNILTVCRNNEKYIALLAQTKHNFYILKENLIYRIIIKLFTKISKHFFS